MKDIILPDDVWECTYHCDKCGVTFTAETVDIQFDRFKQPGTYFFDGSADAAGLTSKYFVECPNKCSLFVVDESDVHITKRKELLDKHRNAR